MGIRGLGQLVQHSADDVIIDKEFVEKLGEKTIILVDSSQILFWICDSMEFVDVELTTYSELEAKIEKFLSTFISLGFQLHFYFDGKASFAKDETSNQRQLQRIESISLLQETGGVTTYPNKISNKPKLGNQVFKSVLQKKKNQLENQNYIDIKYCKGEADPEIVFKSQNENVFAILSNDNDFLFVQHCKIIQLKDLNYSKSKNQIKCKIYSAEKIAEYLSINDINLLYIFSSLAGNDFTQPILSKNPAIFTKLGFNHESTQSNRILFPKIIEFLNNWEKTNKVFNKALKQFPTFAECVEITRQFYHDTKLLIKNNSKERKKRENLIIKKSKSKKVQEKKNKISIGNNEKISYPIPIEFIELDRPSICDIIEHLSCAYFAVKYNEEYEITEESKAIICRRLQKDFGEKQIPLKTYLTNSFFKILKINGNIKSQNDSIQLLYLPLITFKDIQELKLTKSIFIQMKKFQIPSLIKALTLLHITSSSHNIERNLSSRELTSLIIFCIGIDLNQNSSKISLLDYQSVSSSKYQFPSARILTLNSLFNETLVRLTDIAKKQEKLKNKIGEALQYCHGPLLQFIYESMRYNHLSPKLFHLSSIEELKNEILIIFKEIFEINKQTKNSSFNENYFLILLHFYLHLILFPYGNNKNNNKNLKIVYCERKNQWKSLGNQLGSIFSNSFHKKDDNLSFFEDNSNNENQLRLSSSLQSSTESDINFDNFLPILHHKDDIIDKIINYRIVAIQGETGCGKSSKVPQFALQAALDENKKNPLILITQPRRIAAISLAKRVASELGCSIGDIVGYKIGQEAVTSKNTQLLFVTSGWLLEKLIHDTSFFSKCSHILLDEIHERSITSDLLSLLIRQLIKLQIKNQKQSHTTKVIVMSATFDVSMFVDYFKKALDPKNNEIPQLFVGVKRHPVEIIHLDDIFKHKLFKNHPSVLSILPTINKMCNEFNQKSKKPEIIKDLHCLVDSLISILADYHKFDNEGNAILVFLPGIVEIEELEELLLNRITKIENEESDDDDDGFNQDDNNQHPIIETFVLHSLVEQADQMKVFEKIANGTTRVILATNIAESSVTLPKIRYVFDFGLCRQIEFDVQNDFTSLKTSWISQASAKQRSGRCGRVFPGKTIRLYPQSFYSKMEQFEKPEMLRLSLSSTILMLKSLSENVDKNSPFHNPRECLRNALQPPDEYLVHRAIIDLLDNSVLEHLTLGNKEEAIEELKRRETKLQSKKNRNFDEDSDDYDESEEENDENQNDSLQDSKITHLGHFLSDLPFDLRVGRLVAIGARFGRYILHCLLLAVALTNRELFLTPFIKAGEPIQENSFSCIKLSQETREKYSSCLSDLLCVIPQYKDFKQKKYIVGVHNTRAHKFISSVSEISRKLENLLPDHVKWLKIFRRNEIVQFKTLNNYLSFNKEDIQFLRFLIAIAFKKDGFMYSSYKESSQTKAKLKIYEKFDKSVIFTKVPSPHNTPDSLETICPQLYSLAEEISVQENEMKICFRDNDSNSNSSKKQKKLKQQLLSTYCCCSDYNYFKFSPLGVRTLILLSRNNDLLFPSLKSTSSVICFKKMKYHPHVQWKFNDRKCANEKNSIFSFLLPFSSNSSTPTQPFPHFVAIPGTIQYSNNFPRVSRISIIPVDSGLFPILCFMVYDAERKVDKDGFLTSVNLNGTEIKFVFDIKAQLFTQKKFKTLARTVKDLLDIKIDSPPCTAINEEILSDLIKTVEECELTFSIDEENNNKN